MTKIDLLFTIDNSSSMADKRTIMAGAVPDLVNRLVDPPCIDPKTSAEVDTRRADGTCALGVPDFDPVKDIHIGIITSSLRGHGALGVCDDSDQGRLFRTTTTRVISWHGRQPTAAAPDYGYRPVIAAIVNRIRTPLRGCTVVN